MTEWVELDWLREWFKANFVDIDCRTCVCMRANATTSFTRSDECLICNLWFSKQIQLESIDFQFFSSSSSSSLLSFVSCLLWFIFRASIVPPITDVSHHLHSQFKWKWKCLYFAELNIVSQRVSALFHTIAIVEPFALNATIFIVYSFWFFRRSLW